RGNPPARMGARVGAAVGGGGVVASMESDNRNVNDGTSPVSTRPTNIRSLNATEWVAKWVGSADGSCRSPVFRRKFALPSRPRGAAAYVCGLGYYELYVNGRRAGDHVLDPAQTDYEALALYVAHDVAEMLREGENVIDIM